MRPGSRFRLGFARWQNSCSMTIQISPFLRSTRALRCYLTASRGLINFFILIYLQTFCTNDRTRERERRKKERQRDKEKRREKERERKKIYRDNEKERAAALVSALNKPDAL